jgi:hypothetical protein
LVVFDLAASRLQPMTQTAACGINEAIPDSLCSSFRLYESRLVYIFDEIRNVFSHLPKNRYGTMQPHELPEQGIWPFGVEKRRDKRVPADY